MLAAFANPQILIIAALSFLGLGTSPPTPDWGSDLRAAQEEIEQRLRASPHRLHMCDMPQHLMVCRNRRGAITTRTA